MMKLERKLEVNERIAVATPRAEDTVGYESQEKLSTRAEQYDTRISEVDARIDKGQAEIQAFIRKQRGEVDHEVQDKFVAWDVAGMRQY